MEGQWPNGTDSSNSSEHVFSSSPLSTAWVIVSSTGSSNSTESSSFIQDHRLTLIGILVLCLFVFVLALVSVCATANRRLNCWKPPFYGCREKSPEEGHESVVKSTTTSSSSGKQRAARQKPFRKKRPRDHGTASTRRRAVQEDPVFTDVTLSIHEAYHAESLREREEAGDALPSVTIDNDEDEEGASSESETADSVSTRGDAEDSSGLSGDRIPLEVLAAPQRNGYHRVGNGMPPHS